MKEEIKVPAMGESITQATIGTIIKPTGSFVKEEDELLELETDKVNQVLYAPKSGVVTWNIKSEQVVTIGEILGSIDTDQKTTTPIAQQEPKPKAEPKSEQTTVSIPTASQSPLPNTLSTESGIRYSKQDLLAELSQPQAKPAVQTMTTPSTPTRQFPSERETRKKLSKIRKVIATRLVDALQQTAMLTTFMEVDMSKIIALRDSYKEEFIKKYNTKLGFMSFFIKASVSALQAFPEVNTYLDGDEIVYRNYFDISVAVGTDRGVVVPVIRGCDQLSFAGIEAALEDYAKKARSGGLVADDFQGGGFTITNGGTYGSLLSTPILNMPQSAILGMHKIEKRPVVVDDAIVIRPMMYLALSYDHRVIDGKEAVSFLVHIKNMLEDPSRLLIQI